MKKFNLEKAVAGHPIATRSGKPARIIYIEAKGLYPIVALVDEGKFERCIMVNKEGRCVDDGGVHSSDDLRMAEQKWYVNLYMTRKGTVACSQHPCENKSKVMAADAELHNGDYMRYIATVEIEL